LSFTDEAIKIMLKERNLSKKINYDVLRSLTSVVDLTEDEEVGSSSVPKPIVTVIESGPIIRRKDKRKTEEQVVQPSTKKSKISRNHRESQSTDTSAVADDEASTSQYHEEESKIIGDDETETQVVVESGPVCRGEQTTETVEKVVEELGHNDNETIIESGGFQYIDEEEEEECNLHIS
jgi:hypothetical protein